MGVRSPAGLITAHQKPGEKTQALRKQWQIVSGNLYAHMKITAKVTPYFCYPNLDSLSTTAWSHTDLCFENPAWERAE